jgi:hypothetical protein
MTDYAERLRKYNRAGDIQYEWFEQAANYIEALEMKVQKLEYDISGAYYDGYMDGEKAMMNKQEGSSSQDAGVLGVETVEEHEDGSATYKIHMDDRTRGLLADEGLKLVLYCAAAKMDMGVVYDFIKDHMENNRDD